MKNVPPTKNPFIYGRPVQPKEFVSRQSELQSIFSRLRNSESAAIVGEPHSGKTSMLLKIQDTNTRREYLGEESNRQVISFFTLHFASADFTPKAFWSEILEPLNQQAKTLKISPVLSDVIKTDYAPRSLQRLFTYLGEKDIRLVCLLDEFEVLLTHPNFDDPSFFGLLRVLTSQTNGLVLVIASRLNLSEMNSRSRYLLNVGSPFFNHLVEIRLRPFDEFSINQLLNRSEGLLSSKDRLFIRRVAGTSPFLLQAMAAALLETKGDNRLAEAAEEFYKRIHFHFDDLWNYMDDRMRTVAVIMSLLSLDSSNTLSPDNFDVGAFDFELHKLTDIGIVNQVDKGSQFDTKNSLLWHGRQWAISSQAFVWWIRDAVVMDVRTIPTYDDWLHDKRWLFFLTENQWHSLVDNTRNKYKLDNQSIKDLAKNLLDELAD